MGVFYLMEPMNVQTWVRAYDGEVPPNEVYCQTRDVVQARVESLRSSLQQHGWSQTQTALITAVIGELTSNAFDHNIGQWPDIPGCWFEFDLESTQLRVTIADRGQGVHASLSRVRPGIDNMQALLIAFSEHVTGRAPEKRGNGLKFVMNVLRDLEQGEFSYHSGNVMLAYSTQTNRHSDINQLISTSPEVIREVYTTLHIQKSL